MAGKQNNPSRQPFVVAVVGFKNSGKTTVAQALISLLSARGFRVAAAKTSHFDRLDLDSEGRDSRQLYDAGATCVVAQAGLETLAICRHERPAPLSELLGLLPPGIQFVLAEVGAAAEADAVLLCLRSLRFVQETLEVRDVPPGKVLALTGLAAAAPVEAGGTNTAANAGVAGLRELPLLNAADPADREALMRLVLAAAGVPETPQP